MPTAPPNVYDIGDSVRFSVLFLDLNGSPADPTTVTAKYKNPGGTVTTKVYGTDVEVVRDSLGAYHIDVGPDASGTWYYRFTGTGTLKAAGEYQVIVRESVF